MQITLLSKPYIQDILLLSNRVLGESYLTEDYIAEYTSLPNRTSLIAVSNKKLIGYIFIDRLPKEEFINEILIEKEWFSSNLKNNSPILFIKQIAVDEKDQKKGIASALIKDGLNRVNNLTETACCIAWKQGKDVPLNNILLKNGFSYAKTINNYWNLDSVRKKYNCSFCGCPPCNCSAEVYIKKKAFK